MSIYDKRILIVDDDPSILNLLEVILSKKGYKNIYKAADGQTSTSLNDLHKTKFSATEAAEAMQYMAMAGWKTGDMLEGVEGIMNLAATEKGETVIWQNVKTKKKP